MSRKHVGVPKGRACGLNETSEYRDGVLAGFMLKPYVNPYDYWAEYEKHYAWDIGYQKGKSPEMTEEFIRAHM
jgi:hypothetical protein